MSYEGIVFTMLARLRTNGNSFGVKPIRVINIKVKNGKITTYLPEIQILWIRCIKVRVRGE